MLAVNFLVIADAGFHTFNITSSDRSDSRCYTA